MPAEEPGELASKLDRLFRTVHPHGRGEASYREIARSIGEQGGPTISASYLHALRTGSKDNPTKKHLEAIAAFFGVSPAYFYDEGLATRIDDQLELIESMRDAGVHHLSLRARGLPSEAIDMVREMIDHARRLTGLDEPPVSPR